MKYGRLEFSPAKEVLSIIGEPTRNAIQAGDLDVLATEIDPTLADTAAFCEKYDIGTDVSVNCVIVKAKRGETVTYAAVLVLATTQADVNGAVRRELNAKKISFAPMEEATSLTGMEYGGMNPIGLPEEWRILIDKRVVPLERVIIGSGIRSSKILVSGSLLASLPNTTVLDLVKY